MAEFRPESPPPPWRNDLEIQFFGLQRSGNHGILTWIFQQYDSPVLFLHGVDHFCDPYERFHYVEMPNTVPLRRLRDRRKGRFEALRRDPKPVLVYSYENLDLCRLQSEPLVQDRDNTIGKSRRVRRILLLRDFFNWVSSRLKLFEYRKQHLPDRAKTTNSLIDLWLRYAREFAGDTNYLLSDPEAEVVKISYNRWIRDAEYRIELLRLIGTPVKKNDIGHVPDVGGGSSFDATAFSGKSSEMKVEERWKYLLGDEFTDVRKTILARKSSIDEYNTPIFGSTPFG